MSIIEFKRSANSRILDRAKAYAAYVAVSDADRERGLDVHSRIDLRIRAWSDINDADLKSAAAAAAAILAVVRDAAQDAGEPAPALADIITSAVSDEHPHAIRDLARRGERRLAECTIDELSSRDRRFVVAAWARRDHEARQEIARREAANAG